MARAQGLLPSRVLFLGFELRERSMVASSLGPFGYLCCGTTVQEAVDAQGRPAFDVALVDARQRPRLALRHVDELGALAPGKALVVIAQTNDSFVYRHVSRTPRALVLYAPLSAPHLQEALDRLTGGPLWGSADELRRVARP
jgi:hypothetical protein